MINTDVIKTPKNNWSKNLEQYCYTSVDLEKLQKAIYDPGVESSSVDSEEFYDDEIGSMDESI